MEPLGNSMIFKGWSPQTGIEPYIYRNITSITNPCPAVASTESASMETSENSEVLTSYPNPFTTSFTVAADGEYNETLEVAVFTNGGSPVERLTLEKTGSDYGNIGERWPPGIYIVKVLRGKQVTTHMVVKK